MSRILLAATIATALATPIAAQSFHVYLPLLTYPPQPIEPVSDQSCVNLTTLTDPACAPVEK